LQGVSSEASWHAKFANSSYIYAGGFPYELTEGDVIAVFSQFGEVHPSIFACMSLACANQTPSSLCSRLADRQHQPVPRRCYWQIEGLLLSAVRGPAVYTWKIVTLCCRYEDQRSTVLAVDNLNGAELLGSVRASLKMPPYFRLVFFVNNNMLINTMHMLIITIQA
jgi:RNA-binding motif X-linked protein 2